MDINKLREMLEKVKAKSDKIDEDIKDQQIDQRELTAALKAFVWDFPQEEAGFKAELRAISIDCTNKTRGIFKFYRYVKVGLLLFLTASI